MLNKISPKADPGEERLKDILIFFFAIGHVTMSQF